MRSFREIKVSRISFLSEQLRRVDAQTSTSRSELADARAALSLAQDAVDALTVNLSYLEGQREQIQRGIDDLSNQVDPAIMRTLPIELLRAIFVQFVSARTMPLREGCNFIGAFDDFRVRAPWTLASVCSSWRQLALDTPSLWTYVALPERLTEGPASHLVAYVRDLLSRSGQRPLDISISWEEIAWSEDVHGVIFDALATVVERWRSCSFGLPNGAGSPARFSPFRRSTPLLEELVACVDNYSIVNPWHAAFPHYLPDCPRLRFMRTDGCHIIWRSPHVGLPALSHLEVDGDLPPDVVWGMLQHSPQMEALTLHLHANREPSPGPAPGQLRLPRLRALGLYSWAVRVFSAWPDLLLLPAVESLVSIYSPIEILATVAPSIATLTALDIDSRLTANDPQRLAVFCKLRTLKITFYSAPISEGFFDAVAPDAWPALEELQLDRFNVDGALANELLRFVRARTVALPRGERRLRAVTLTRCVADTWLEQQLGVLLHA